MKLTVVKRIASLIENKETDKVQSILERFSLKERHDIVSKKIKRKSLLFAAVKNKEIDLVKYLVEKCGANVKDAGPCLSMAENNMCIELVEFLAENGADLNSINHEDKSPLHFACINGDMPLVEYLVENGAHIDNDDIEGNTPLMVSVKYPNICRYLLLNNADPNRVNVHGKTALMLAVEQEDSHFSVHILVSFNANVNFTNDFGENAVFLAIQKGFMQLRNVLQFHGAEITRGLAGNHQICRCYFSLQNDERHPLFDWRTCSHTPFVEMDAQRSTDSSLGSILDILSANNRNAILYLEKQFGLQNPYTIRVIKMAACNTENSRDCVRLFAFFLDTLMSTTDITFFRMCSCIGPMCIRLIWILRNSCTDKTSENLQEIFRHYAKHFEEFAARFHRLKSKERLSKYITIDSLFYTILRLMKTVHNLSPEKLSALNESVEKILSVDLRGTGNNSLLHFCIKNGFPLAICKLLLSCKADVNSQNGEGLTPVHYLIHLLPYQQKETIEMFLAHGFDMNAWSEEEDCLSCTLKKLRLLPQPVKNTTLRCLAAKVVSENEFIYKDEVPIHLQRIVYSHF